MPRKIATPTPFAEPKNLPTIAAKISSASARLARRSLLRQRPKLIGPLSLPVGPALSAYLAVLFFPWISMMESKALRMIHALAVESRVSSAFFKAPFNTFTAVGERPASL